MTKSYCSRHLQESEKETPQAQLELLPFPWERPYEGGDTPGTCAPSKGVTATLVQDCARGAWEKVRLTGLEPNVERVQTTRDVPVGVASQKPEAFPDTLESENGKIFLNDSTDIY